MPDPAALAAALRAMLPAGAGVGAALTDAPPPLWPGETLFGAVPKRQREFAAGRAAARAALADLGHPPAAIPRHDNRAPLWPPGITGSITHSRDVALAATLHTPASPGIDIEPHNPLPDNVLDAILTPPERAAMPSAALSRVVFSAKESFFKAQHPRTARMIGFDAATVALSAGAFRLTVATTLPGLPAGTVLPGRWTIVQDHILTALVIP